MIIRKPLTIGLHGHSAILQHIFWLLVVRTLPHAQVNLRCLYLAELEIAHGGWANVAGPFMPLPPMQLRGLTVHSHALAAARWSGLANMETLSLRVRLFEVV